MRCRTAVLLVGGLACCACSDLAASLPTSPTVAAGAATPGTVLRTERWTVRLTVRDVAGMECADALLTTWTGWLTLQLRDDGAVRFSYETESGAVGEWSGWNHETGVEGSGTVYEFLPCAASATRGAPSTLTGTFSPDGRSFTATELRRHTGGASGEILYYIAWTATAA